MSIWSASIPPITKPNNKILPFKKDVIGKYAKPSPVIYADLVHSPINLHHATGDSVTKFEDSRDLAYQLNSLGKECYLYSYDSNNHLFNGENFFTAVKRDLEFFQSILKSENITK
jgi:dipeptidyl aminopeptidase/acylaminoacyl peptidase